MTEASYLALIQSAAAPVVAVTSTETVTRVDDLPSPVVKVSPPIGIPGRDGRDGPQALVYEFATPAMSWMIVHNLGRYPAGLTKINSAGDMIHGATTYPDFNTVVIAFSAPTSGAATMF